ncbi:GATA transcription factor 26 isoform X1 [Physcomitrium patens]|uniref:Uncharacterized protein n=2 Tax=Physcomitrium patens TaxID=3218 RepID=A0A2K1IGP2_PHYPA|nr:GATA transcription factor 26-like isoform X1 [Physcomitrium patens]XP_024364461.1 GATA transcription factor 26-like isoform X1 [Physcomitrium patens]XP_024364462.1 GATA transcription factor 26-like isoform X1 [Physcomitrium patens]PNR28443.1 hypothetical protein PHYPA_029035 [Physcomitrium patens]|eukprot:XP_024364460.1 GATA transcription factor 26-like isoform X1 [Physcomitrella patens]
MGKQGPCGHCGIATTPLWRNGPPEKPVLCNACGSRWRTKGTLSNYMPMHSGGFGGSAIPEGSALVRGRRNSKKLFSEPRSHKRKEPCEGHRETRAPLRLQKRSLKAAGNDSISTSSLSSNVSGLDDAANITSSNTHLDVAVSSPFWEGHIPTRRRTSTSRVCTSVDRLSQQFQQVVCDVPTTSSTMMHDFADDLLVDSKPSTMADEIGLGSVFIRQTTLGVDKTESRSHSVEDPYHTRVQNNGAPLQQLPNGTERLTSVRGKEKAKEYKKVDSGHLKATNTLLENYPYNKRDVLQSCQSPLAFLELKDILNFDTFTGLLTEQEQGQLMRFLSSVDVPEASESLKEMFTSAEFEGSLNNFQHLLEEGMFEVSMLGVNSRILQHFQQLLIQTDLTSSGWMEQFLQLQNRSRRRGGSVDLNKIKELNKEKVKGSWLSHTKNTPANNKQSPGRLPSQSGISVQSGGLMNASVSSGIILETLNVAPDLGNSSNDRGYGFEGGGDCFPSISLLSTEQMSANDLPNLQPPGPDETETDLLFNMPTNMMTFQDTALLQQPVWSKAKEIDTYQVDMGSPLTSNMWHMESTPAELFWT